MATTYFEPIRRALKSLAVIIVENKLDLEILVLNYDLLTNSSHRLYFNYGNTCTDFNDCRVRDIDWTLAN